MNTGKLAILTSRHKQAIDKSVKRRIKSLQKIPLQ